jgi:hypothetical protein
MRVHTCGILTTNVVFDVYGVHGLCLPLCGLNFLKYKIYCDMTLTWM